MAKIILVFLTILLPFQAWAACSWNGNYGTVASPYNHTDVDDCVSDASSKTGYVTVIIPPCNASWTGNATINLNSGFSNVASLTIRGTGQDQSVIAGGRFQINTKEGKKFRITNMKVSGASGIAVYGDGKSWRIDHIYFDQSSGYVNNRVIWVQPTSWRYTNGVIDNCTFYENRGQAFFYRGGLSDGGNFDYGRPLNLGTSDSVYIEDCNFYKSSYAGGTEITDCDGGGQFVFRHNIVTNNDVAMHDAMISNLRSCRKWEIYNNVFNNADIGNVPFSLQIRGGTGVAFDNVINGSVNTAFINLALYRTYSIGQNPWDTLCGASSGTACLGSTVSTYPENCTPGDGKCSGNCVNKDGAGIGGYPCRDQIGWTGNGTQTSAPALFWNNRKCSVYNPSGCSSPDSFVNPSVQSQAASYIREGVDYCKGDSSMPLTCNGVTMTYTPYTYPHPLRGPTKVTNLRVAE